MLSLRKVSVRCSRQVKQAVRSTDWHRDASLTSSIGRGVRRAAAALGQAEKRRVREGNLGFWELRDQEKVAQARDNVRKRRDRLTEEEARLAFLNAEPATERVPSEEYTRRRKAKAIARAHGMLVEAPAAVPYTESASEFLYGTFAVLAALQANRRKLHKLYIWCGEDGRLNDNGTEVTEIVRHAKLTQVQVLRVAGNWDKMMDRMADRRPHNGVILEASAIPKIPANCLARVESTHKPIGIELRSDASVNETDLPYPKNNNNNLKLPRSEGANRYPFLLWLDKILDPGNMGAIFRSAYFFGIDGVILPRHGTAPLSPVAIKSSVGAAEHVPILHIDNESAFMKQSQENGWVFFAAAAPQSKSTFKMDEPNAEKAELSPEEVLQSHPCVLVLGNEGEGVRKFLQQAADHSIAIHGARSDSIVDSLNVSVAAALLANRFLRSVQVASSTT